MQKKANKKTNVTKKIPTFMEFEFCSPWANYLNFVFYWSIIFHKVRKTAKNVGFSKFLQNQHIFSEKSVSVAIEPLLVTNIIPSFRKILKE